MRIKQLLIYIINKVRFCTINHKQGIKLYKLGQSNAIQEMGAITVKVSVAAAKRQEQNKSFGFRQKR